MNFNSLSTIDGLGACETGIGIVGWVRWVKQVKEVDVWMRCANRMLFSIFADEVGTLVSLLNPDGIILGCFSLHISWIELQ